MSLAQLSAPLRCAESQSRWGFRQDVNYVSGVLFLGLDAVMRRKNRGLVAGSRARTR